METKRNTAFIVELFIMFAILLIVIVTVTSLSMKTRQQSIDAGHLTEAVICAENTAEITSGADDPDEVVAMIKKMDGAANVQKAPGTGTAAVTADIDFKGDNEKVTRYMLRVTLAEERSPAGKYIEKKISVYLPNHADKAKLGKAKNIGKAKSIGKAIYTLNTGNYMKGGGS